MEDPPKNKEGVDKYRNVALVDEIEQIVADDPIAVDAGIPIVADPIVVDPIVEDVEEIVEDVEEIIGDAVEIVEDVEEIVEDVEEIVEDVPMMKIPNVKVLAEEIRTKSKQLIKERAERQKTNLEKAITRIQEDYEKMTPEKKEVHDKFMADLKQSCNAYRDALINVVIKVSRNIIRKGRKSFKIWDFRGIELEDCGCKMTTLQYGFWDKSHSRFSTIKHYYAGIKVMPFAQAQEFLKSEGYILKDISDSSKSLKTVFSVDLDI
jgi:hypothetical protein